VIFKGCPVWLPAAELIFQPFFARVSSKNREFLTVKNYLYNDAIFYFGDNNLKGADMKVLFDLVSKSAHMGGILCLNHFEGTKPTIQQTGGSNSKVKKINNQVKLMVFGLRASVKSFQQILLVLLLLASIPSASAALGINALAPSEADVCYPARFVVYVNNTGSTASSIGVNVTMPDGFSYDPGSTHITSPSGVSQQDPVVWGQHLNWTSSAWILGNNQFLKIEFNLTAGCSAPSGKRLKVDVKYNGGSVSRDSLSIVVNQGLLKVTKEPNVIEAGKWDIITWTVRLENLGTGPAFNVLVNDTPSSGLELLGINSPGNSLNWSYERINPGETKTIDATFRIIGCENLINLVNVSWGCGEICQKTYAKSSVKFIPRVPDVLYSFNPSSFVVPYCNNTTVTVNLLNQGQGNATRLRMVFSDFNAPYAISNVSGAIYYENNHTFYIGDVQPGGTIPGGEEMSFSFDFGMPFGDCASAGSSGVFNVQVYYYDDCGNEWYPPVSQVLYSMDASTVPSISVSKSGDGSLYLGDTGDYTLGVIYHSGNCGVHSLPENTLVDLYPASFEVVDAAGGTVNETLHTITWTNQNLNDTLPWSQTVRLKATRNSTICNCGNVFTNEFSVNALLNCCGCPLSASTSLPIIVQCFNGTVLSSAIKTASPGLQENCRNITYTNTYIFNNTSGLSWADISFLEQGSHSQIFPDGGQSGNAAFIINNSCTNISQITLGSYKNLSFLEDACDQLQDGDVLNITYTLRAPVKGSFIDWSGLCVRGYDSGCAGVSCTQVGASVNVEEADYSLSITGVPSRMSPCMAFNLTINLIKNSPDDDPLWIGHDMYITYNDTSYRYIGPATIEGIDNYLSPLPPNREVPHIDGHNITWYLGRNVSRGGNITFTVEKRCPLSKDASAVLNYTDNCGELLVRMATTSPSLLTEGDIFIQKNPEVIYALDRNANWKIYVTNKGSGTAYNVTVVDRLDRDLNYTGSRIRRCLTCPLLPEPSNTTVIDSGNCGPDKVFWRLGNLTPKQQAMIEMNATLCGCDNRNNVAYATVGCGGYECQNVSDSSRVELVGTQMQVARHEAGPVDDCGTNDTFTIEVRNTGPTRVYNVSISELLPAGLELNGTPTVTGAVPTSTDYSGNPLLWRFNQSEGLAPGTRILIVFNASVTGPCDFQSGPSLVNVNYIEPCGRAGPEVESQIQVLKAGPSLTITKTPATKYADTGEIVRWTLTLQNVGNYVAKNVTLYDVLPANVAWNSAYPQNNSGVGTQANPLVWNLADIPVGGTRRILLNATVVSCTSTTTNRARVSWGCCPSEASASSSLITRPSVAPGVDVVQQISLNTCGGDFAITIRNTGATALVKNITDVMPLGFIYKKASATIGSNNATHAATFVYEPQDYSAINRTIVWNSSNIDKIYRNEIITIKFKVVNCTDCCKSSASSSNRLAVNITDSCGNPLPTITSNQPVTPTKGILSVRKEPEVQYLGDVTWTIYIDNSGNEVAQNISVEDVLGDGFTGVASTNGTITANHPYPGWTTIRWAGQKVPVGTGMWSVVVTAHASDICGLAHTNNVTVKGNCDTGCIYSNDSATARALTLAALHLDSLETLLRGQTDLISSFESLLKNSTLDGEESLEFLESFDDLANRQQQGLDGFEDVVLCNWRDLDRNERVKFTDSFEDLLRRQAIMLSSNEDLLKRGFCLLDEDNKNIFLDRFEARIKAEEALLEKFRNWVYSQQYLDDDEEVAWEKFLASLEDLIRRQSRLLESFRQLLSFSCDQPYLVVTKRVNMTSVDAGDPLKYEITVSVNGTGLEKVENITINDSLLGVVQWPGIDLNAGESRSWTIDAAHHCTDCNNCTCKVCDFAVVCGKVIIDELHNATICVPSKQVCVNISQFGAG
jgi:uncharacterized repeat protein (TIGR01451 family)